MSTTVSIGVDGPYGNDASVVKQLQYFDRVLLLAGGVGATAILPLYRHIRTASSSTPVRLLWAVRGASELMWAENILSILADNEIEKGPRGVRTEDIFRDAAMSPARPDLQSEVDEMFGEDFVAVVVCRPATMVDDLRAAVGFWIEAGRDVYRISIKRAFPCNGDDIRSRRFSRNQVSVSWCNGTYVAEFRAADDLEHRLISRRTCTLMNDLPLSVYYVVI